MTPNVAQVFPLRGAAAVAALALAAVHLFAGRLRFLDRVPRSRVLSIGGGASVAYVFVHALPELARAGEALEAEIDAVAFVEKHVYLVALAGFVVYYGLERYVTRAKGERSASPESETAAPEAAGGPSAATDGSGPARAAENDESVGGVFWLHVGSFVVYNGLVGYLLFHREAPGLGAIGLFAVAMALHFLVNDYGLRQHHRGTYHRYGRWLLAGAVVVGGGLGAVSEPNPAALGALFAFLSGGIVLNVVKEELPPERESRFRAFAVGAGVYAALLVSI